MRTLKHHTPCLLPCAAFAALLAALVLLGPGPAHADNWPAWRGPTGQGLCAEKGLPLRWSATENVKWKVALPDAGNSTPAVWGGKVFVTQAVKRGKERMLLCLDRDGRELWRRAVEHAEEEPTHGDNPYCSASPVTDGERVVAFHGSAGLLCYDLDGKELWRRDLGKLHHIWGNAASPVLHGDLCLVNCGPGERTYLAALEVRTGKTVWQVDIPGGALGGESSTWTGSWSTPLIARWGDREEIIASFPHRVRAFDPRTGAELWSCDGLGKLVYTSPLAGEGSVVAMSGFMGPAVAVRAGGKGDVTAERRLWRHEKAQQRIGSGVIAGGHVYIVNDPGVAECIELQTGKTVWRERLGAACWSSAVLSDGLLYVPDQEGDCHVFRAAPRFEVVARSPLGERTRASIAVSDGELFIRTYKHLWCIREAKAAAPGGGGSTEAR
ncbi:MAG: PQQ-binding-like beta-propeller repeat protein [Planctomycetes bacterium]|nr:PQQ-binding-like beta-propeller repeat protein [Planctomycetota bacterium]